MLSDALQGMGEPWVIATALILTTFLLEDVAIAAGVSLSTQGNISWTLSFFAVAFGIAFGDLLLYGLGVSARRIAWLRKRYIKPETHKVISHLHSNLFSAILLARVIPGLRLLTYTACGFTRASWGQFLIWVNLAVLFWTAGLFWLSISAGQTLARWLSIPQSVAVALPMLTLALALPLYKYLKTLCTRNSI